MERIDEDTGLNPSGWMLTFSDMVTLLLTFFVMIIAITTIDPSITSDISGQDLAETAVIQPGPGILGFSNPRLLASLAEALEDLPENASLDDDEVKAALFQLDPDDPVSYQRLEREISDSVSIFRDERGLVIRWSHSVLFPEGTSILREENAILLNRMAGLLATLTLPVSIECHTNPLSDLEGGDGVEAYSLSASRARVTLDYLTSLGLAPRRFRLGAFGGSRPLTRDPESGSDNSRLEIILYTPPQSSWKG